jgi:gluconate 2-dehydrogenase gamma chain
MSPSEREAVLAMLHSPDVTPVTRKVLLERLDARQERQFLSEAEFGRLGAVATRLVPHDPAEIDLIGPVDARLQSGLSGDGWRYADAPPDAEAYRSLLAALPDDFESQSGEQQDAALGSVQSSHARAFEDLLSELTETFFAHPITQYRIGYVGFADAPGWPHVGPNELEAREVSYGEQ